MKSASLFLASKGIRGVLFPVPIIFEARAICSSFFALLHREGEARIRGRQSRGKARVFVFRKVRERERGVSSIQHGSKILSTLVKLEGDRSPERAKSRQVRGNCLKIERNEEREKRGERRAKRESGEGKGSTTYSFFSFAPFLIPQ